jgi:hypothetical protein
MKLPPGVALATAVQHSPSFMQMHNGNNDGTPQRPVPAIVAATMPVGMAGMNMNMSMATVRAHTPPLYPSRGGSNGSSHHSTSPTLAVAVSSTMSPTPMHPSSQQQQQQQQRGAPPQFKPSPHPPPGRPPTQQQTQQQAQFSSQVHAQVHAAQQAFLQPRFHPSAPLPGLGGPFGMGGAGGGPFGRGIGGVDLATMASFNSLLGGMGTGTGAGGAMTFGGMGMGMGNLATLPNTGSFASLPVDAPPRSFSPLQSPSPSPDSSPVESAVSPLPLPLSAAHNHAMHARTGSVEFSSYRNPGAGGGAPPADDLQFLRADLRDETSSSEFVTPAHRGTAGPQPTSEDGDSLTPLTLSRNVTGNGGGGTAAPGGRDLVPETPRTQALSHQLSTMSTISWEGRRTDISGGTATAPGAPFALRTPPAPAIAAVPARINGTNLPRPAASSYAQPGALSLFNGGGGGSMLRSPSPPHPSQALLPANQTPLHIGGSLAPPPLVARRVPAGGGGGPLLPAPVPATVAASASASTHSPLFMARPDPLASSAAANSGGAAAGSAGGVVGMDMLELEQ